MPLLRDVQRLFGRKRRPTGIDLTRTQAARLSAALDTADGSETPARRGVDRCLPERRPVDNGRRKDDEIMVLVRRIGDGLAGQEENSGRLVALLEHLPAALESVQEVNRRSANLVESLHEHFTRTGRREEALNHGLGTMAESANRHTEVLGLLQQQLNGGAEATAQLTDGLERLCRTLDELGQADTRTSELLMEATEAAQRRESEMAAVLGRTQRWMVAALVMCGLASITGVIIAAAALTS